MNSPDISVVVCTYNRKRMLRLSLNSLMHQDTGGSFTYEIVVVDDASTDDTANVVAELQKKCLVPLHYARGRGHGVAEARNLGLAWAQGAWVAFTDDDQVNELNWLNSLYELSQLTQAKCVGGAVQLRFEVEPIIPLSLVTKKILGYKIQPEGRVRRLMDCPGTGNVMIHRTVFERIGIFDPTLEWGGEDAEFMMRILNADISIWFTPLSVVYHLIPPYRVTLDYYRWISMRVGVALSEIDGKVRGLAILSIICIARLAQAFMINIPRLCLSLLLGDTGHVLEFKCKIWRAITYARKTLQFLAPGLFPQRIFFEELKFRGERSKVTEKTLSSK